ncbi:MAG: hypothetical protein GKR94_21830 [Gammaproteobacteria bacterium]|nr:hypothetical protein [Gammaproteobacteria bacterium]
MNCGCVQLPHMADWAVSQPGRQLFSDEELVKGLPAKRALAREANPSPVRHAQ